MTTKRRTTTAGTSFGDPAHSARVTCQFNDKGKKVYDLQCNETLLSLTMSAAPALGEQWEIEAVAAGGVASTVLRAAGSSRDAALSAVGVAWDQFGGRDGYGQVNWRAIHDALLAVRGI